MQRFTVSVDTDVESNWYLTPSGFDDFETALRFAAGIAKSLHGNAGAPDAIWIHGSKWDDGPWPVHALIFLAMINGWFDDDPS
ncbi:hypothetical protein Q3C01_08680 [Bradyrhizobium sp. UFLA05-109]